MRNRMASSVLNDEENVLHTDTEAPKVSFPCVGACNQSLASAMNVSLYFAMVLVPMFAMLAPLFFSESIHQFSTNGELGKTLRSSTRLLIAESISIGCTLPGLSDIFVERVTPPGATQGMSLSMRHRLLFLLTLSLVGVLYISLRDFYFMPFLYIVLNRIKVRYDRIELCFVLDRKIKFSVCLMNTVAFL